MNMEYNKDRRSGILFVGINEKSDFAEYFSGDLIMEGIERKHKIIESFGGDEVGRYFRVPVGCEVEYRERLMADPAVGNVEYVVEGVYELSESMDGIIGSLKDLAADIFSCSTKEEVNALIKKELGDLERFMLK